MPSWSDAAAPDRPSTAGGRRSPRPPNAARSSSRPTATSRIDDWYWLRDKDDPEVIAHLEAENAYTEAMTAGTEDLQADPLRGDRGPHRGDRPVGPGPEGPMAVLQPNRGGPELRHPLPVGRPRADRRRSRSTATPDEQVLLDENLLADGHEYFALGNLAVSPDHRWLAYSTDTTGGERYTMRFTDLATGDESPESIEDTSYGVAWANDNATVFYVRVDEAMRPHQLWRHRVGTDPAGDVLVYEEPDDHFYLGVGRTKDDRYILMGLDSKVTSEVRALDADDPLGDLHGHRAAAPGIEYSVDHDRGDPASDGRRRFLIVTNDGAEDFRLMEAPDDAPGRTTGGR